MTDKSNTHDDYVYREIDLKTFRVTPRGDVINGVALCPICRAGRLIPKDMGFINPRDPKVSSMALHLGTDGVAITGFHESGRLWDDHPDLALWLNCTCAHCAEVITLDVAYTDDGHTRLFWRYFETIYFDDDAGVWRRLRDDVAFSTPEAEQAEYDAENDRIWLEAIAEDERGGKPSHRG